MEFRRKLYTRGSSFETTIPMPLLLTLDAAKKYDVLFSFDQEKQAWQIRFEEREETSVMQQESSQQNSQQKKYLRGEQRE